MNSLVNHPGRYQTVDRSRLFRFRIPGPHPYRVEMRRHAVFMRTAVACDDFRQYEIHRQQAMNWRDMFHAQFGFMGEVKP